MIDRETYIYLAGLFDGEACITFKRTLIRRNNRKGRPIHNVQIIRVEISMTNENIINWIHQVFGFGWSKARKFNTVPSHYKQQWRWACSYRNAYKLATLLYPYSKILKSKWETIIQYYDNKDTNTKVYPSLDTHANTDPLFSS